MKKRFAVMVSLVIGGAIGCASSADSDSASAAEQLAASSSADACPTDQQFVKYSGSVESQDGSPIAHASICATVDGVPGDGVKCIHSKTDGSYVIDVYACEDMLVQYKAPGFATVRTHVRVSADGSGPMVVMSASD